MGLFGSDDTDDEQEEDNQESEDRGVPDIGRFHRDVIAPKGINEGATKATVGEHHTKTVFINGWPDTPQNGFLESVYFGSRVQNDVSIHISPYDPDKALSQLEDAVRKARSQLGAGNGGLISSMTRQSDFEETKEVYDALRQTDANLFDVGMYVTIRAETSEELERASEELVRKLKTAPALTKPAVPGKRQLDGMKSVSPIGKDALNYKTEMLGGAVGAMFPFSSTTVVEEGGVDFGMHAANNSPVIVDRFARSNGYNQFTVGKIGSGKSFSTNLNVLRTYASRNDTILFLVDPLNGFDNVCDALGGRKVTVGGKVNINPMELQETPERVLERAPQIDPYAMKKKNLMDFFAMYFDKRDEELGDARGILEQAIDKSYEDHGITRDISTHSNDSPTISHLREVLQDMVDNPDEYASVKDEDHYKDIKDRASRLLIGLQPFTEGGELENLSKESDLDLRGEDVVYFDLSQNEGSGDLGLMMQVLFSDIYERSKASDKKAMMALDEAHYVMQDAKSLDFLEQAVRHSRHYDLSINFITQNVYDFFSHDKAEAIVKNCSIRLFHRVEESIPDDIADTLDLTESEQDYIQSAQPGDPDVGFSEALLGVQEYGNIPIKVIASEFEESLITMNPDETPDYGLGELEDRLREMEFTVDDFKEIGMSEEQAEQAYDELYGDGEPTEDGTDED